MNNGIRRLLPLFLAFAPLAACTPAAEPPPLAGATIGGPFSLIDQDGHRVTDRSFAGRYRLIYFGYTFCPDVCPTSLATIGQGLRRFEAQDAARAAKVQPIFVTVDPARDTPAVMKAYVANFHPRLIGLTGSEAEIAATAKTFAVVRQKGSDPRVEGYTMDHPAYAILFGPAGEPIAMVTHDQDAAAVAATLDRWVK